MYTVNRVRDGSPATLEKELTLGRTTVNGMDPVPGADTTAVWARRHVLGDLEDGVDGPNALMVNTEHDQILGFDAVHIRSVSDGQGATLQVIDALKRKQFSGFSLKRRGCAETYVCYRKSEGGSVNLDKKGTS